MRKAAKQQMPESLLERLAFMVGCEYLSDLRSPKYRDKIGKVAWGMQPTEFDIGEWNEVIEYIIGKDVSFSTPHEARACIVGLGFLDIMEIPEKDET